MSADVIDTMKYLAQLRANADTATRQLRTEAIDAIQNRGQAVDDVARITGIGPSLLRTWINTQPQESKGGPCWNCGGSGVRCCEYGAAR